LVEIGSFAAARAVRRDRATTARTEATAITAPTFGCRVYAASVSCVTLRSGPICPQPARCGSAAPIGAMAAAIRSATTAAQITVGTTRTWLRTPTCPSGRR
jgi:hypothetical protein